MKKIWPKIKLRKSRDFQKVIKTGKKIANGSFMIFFYKKKNQKSSSGALLLQDCKVGISIPQKILKKANQRNKCKRQVRSIVYDVARDNGFTSKLEKWNLVVVMRKEFLDLDFQSRKNSFTSLILFLVRISKKSINKDKIDK